jgi:selT/selW/selH-like putative selenoprotein
VTGVKATLVKGSNGIFDVMVDGKMVWSKYQTGTFPDENELVAKISGA